MDNIIKQTVEKNGVRYDAVKHLASKFEWSTTPGYAHFRYEAITTDPEARSLDARDVALLADGGNLCFGGRNFGKRDVGDKTIFSGVVHTD